VDPRHAAPAGPSRRGSTRPDADVSALAAVGLRPGEQVRFRRVDRARWQSGTVHRIERDGTLRVTDVDGSARTVPFAHIQVRARAGRWEPLADRAARAVQLTLL
jgi:hypothetical protein